MSAFSEKVRALGYLIKFKPGLFARAAMVHVLRRGSLEDNWAAASYPGLQPASQCFTAQRYFIHGDKLQGVSA